MRLQTFLMIALCHHFPISATLSLEEEIEEAVAKAQEELIQHREAKFGEELIVTDRAPRNRRQTRKITERLI